MPHIRIQSLIGKVAKAINLDLMSDAEKKIFDQRTPSEQARYVGFGAGYRQNFDTPNLICRSSEEVYSNGNSFVVLGLDRPSNIFSGFGGMKNTHCAAIDIVAGRLGYRGSSRTKTGERVNIDPNFKLDAARIYISQKSDPDGYFNLVEGKVGSTSLSDPRSAVVLKADMLRLVARENIKLVTRTDDQNSQGAALGNETTANYGIDLIALNEDADLQPLVKGENLVKCLNNMIESIHDLRDLFDNFLEHNRQVTKAFIKHTHRSPFFGYPTAPDFETSMPVGIESLVDVITDVQFQLFEQTQKLNGVQTNYLETPAGCVAANDGKGLFVLSRYNNTN